MRAELRQISCMDVLDLESYSPDKETFSLMLEMEIGAKHSDESEIFYLEIVSPAALADRLQEGTILFGRGMLIMQDFSYQRVRKFLQKWCSRAHGKTWADVSEQLSRFAEGEFLDYQLFSEGNIS
ncbi:MAG: hypothetical protein JEZ00_19890 [Anaerolineaceae bacterium]|nr:hypothetical protein [Anaerolineaceae bacterium]